MLVKGIGNIHLMLKKNDSVKNKKKLSSAASYFASLPWNIHKINECALEGRVCRYLSISNGHILGWSSYLLIPPAEKIQKQQWILWSISLSLCLWSVCHQKILSVWIILPTTPTTLFLYSVFQVVHFWQLSTTYKDHIWPILVFQFCVSAETLWCDIAAYYGDVHTTSKYSDQLKKLTNLQFARLYVKKVQRGALNAERRNGSEEKKWGCNLVKTSI